MADEDQKIWTKPVMGGGAVAVLALLTGYGIGGAILAGIAGVGITHLVMSRMGGSKARAASAPTAQPEAPEPAPTAQPEAKVAAEPAPAQQAASAAAAPGEAEPLIKPSTPLPGEAELAARKGTWKYTPEGA